MRVQVDNSIVLPIDVVDWDGRRKRREKELIALSLLRDVVLSVGLSELDSESDKP